MKETNVTCHWASSVPWDERGRLSNPGLVLYQIYGRHHLYGSDVLLYIGRSDKTVEQRLKQHHPWVIEEYDEARVSAASILQFEKWADCNKYDDDEHYPKADQDLVARVEALLIYAHGPVYNGKNKSTPGAANGLRIFNTGKIGSLYPEVSYMRFGEDVE